MTKEKKQIKAELRTVLGRKVKKIRKEGLLPATVYGRNFEPISVQFKAMELERLFNEVGESGLVELLIDTQKIPVLFRNPQYSPVESDLVHIDCYKVNLKEKITATVPIEFIGESQAVKEGNNLVEVSNDVEIEALPADLPESITVDITVLNTVDDMITVGDIKLGEKMEMVTQLDQVIVKVEKPRVEEEAPVEEEAQGAAPAMNQKTEEEKAEAEKKEE
ncbi:MAG: 50S ribosomal protein L25 [Candidatus Shapirobacteria bacterium]|nr:50S ribosomal protein L25 [Candidatus Shapirobacteria bacterium]MDD3002497.1 50S ribosomal protein L25 [Candidatus Shapirobacteria bacterium]MDD4383402.1 50S ribosomal protein L25 [Candidatus Shapirobacteria bacterium]